MKLLKFLILLCVFGCQESKREEGGREKLELIKSPEELWTDKMRENYVYEFNDTILIDLDSINTLDSIKNQAYENYTDTEILDFLKVNSYEDDETICLIGSKRINYTSWGELVDIPIPIYKRIFPNSEEYLKVKKRKIKKGSSVGKGGGLVEIEYGEKITIEKKFKKIYWTNELDNYIQLVLLNEGKYFPKGYLIHLSKEKLELIDEVLIFDSFVDAGEIQVILGCLYNETDYLKIWDIHNSRTKPDWQLADTIQVNYRIHPNGEINKISENLLKNEK